MGDSIVENVVDFSLQNLVRLLADEVNLGADVEAKIRSLRAELDFMDAFIKSSEGKHKDDLMEVVVNQIRDVAHEVEDVVDTYVANVTLQRRRNIFNKLLHCLCQEMILHDVDSEIEIIKRSIREIYENKGKYNIKEGEFQSKRSLEEENAKLIRERRRDVEEEEVVGLLHDSIFMIQKLKAEDSSLRVFSIIGMGGLGKTTLAKKIYNNHEVKRMFSCRAWGYVSNDYKARELLLTLLQCFNSSTFENKYLSVEQLKERVRDCLRGKKYLVVLDDIWKAQVWDDVKQAFPNDRNGSRILITSRIREVALYPEPNSSSPYVLPFLDEEESWKLFCKKVFREKECPDYLERLGREMVESCKGLPLAIIVLAGLLAKKDKLQTEWTRIKDGIDRQLAQDKIVMEILKLSYDNLPRELKPCFLYLGIYPEDSEIPVRRLIELWIAEGFIQPKNIGTSNAPEPENVADYYLDELVDRSLVKVARKRLDGGVKTCRIHDLLRDLCISESKANKFMEVDTDINKCSSRRLSLHCKTELSPTKYCQSHPRSLFLFAEWVEWDGESKGWEWIRKNLKLVRVLDIDSVRFVSAPHGLKTLIHLRNLRIVAANLKIGNKILTSICNLWNLETLDLLVHGSGVTIPSGMWKLKRLRHVRVGYVAWVKQPACMVRGENSETAVSLQTLCHVYVTPELVLMMNNGFFPNLTKLSLSSDETSSPQQLPSLHHLNKLRKLKMFLSGFHPPSAACVFPPNLTRITLREIYDGLDSGFMNTLGQLGSLQVLKLENGSISGSINCVAGEFPQLEVFHMIAITITGQWRQEKGAMPHLRRLFLSDCEYWDEQEQRYLPLRNLQ